MCRILRSLGGAHNRARAPSPPSSPPPPTPRRPSRQIRSCALPSSSIPLSILHRDAPLARLLFCIPSARAAAPNPGSSSIARLAPPRHRLAGPSAKRHRYTGQFDQSTTIPPFSSPNHHPPSPSFPQAREPSVARPRGTPRRHALSDSPTCRSLSQRQTALSTTIFSLRHSPSALLLLPLRTA